MTAKRGVLPVRSAWLACLAASSAGLAAAQDAGGAAGPQRLVTLEPRVSVSQGYTSNLKLASDFPDAALVTTLTPGISLRARGLELSGDLDYALNGLYYLKSAEPDRVTHHLSSQLRWTPSEGGLFLQAAASMSQQNVSALGPRTVDPSLANPNATQVANVSVTPGFRMRLADVAVLESHVNLVLNRAKDTNLGDQSGYAVSASLRPAHSGGLLSWRVAGDAQVTTPRVGRRTLSDRLIGTLIYTPDPDWQFGVNLGADANNYTTVNRERKAAYGVQASWRPSPRTLAEAAVDHRAYGNTHSLAFEYRLPRLSLRVSDLQQVSPPGVQGGLGSRTNFDLLYQMLASLEPDPDKRRTLVLAVLQSNGLSPDAVSTPGFLSSAVSLSRTRQIAAMWQGVRTTVSLSLGHTRNTRIGAASVPGDDLGLADQISQRGAILSLSHRLTSMSSLSLGYTDQRTTASQGALNGSHLRTLSGAWSTRLTESRMLSVSVRRAEMDSPLRPYVENAVTGTLQQQF